MADGGGGKQGSVPAMGRPDDRLCRRELLPPPRGLNQKQAGRRRVRPPVAGARGRDCERWIRANSRGSRPFETEGKSGSRSVGSKHAVLTVCLHRRRWVLG